MLSAVVIMFTDLLILNKKHTPDPYWWSHNVFTTLAHWSYNSNTIDVNTLKSRHAAYMKNGIALPDSIDNIREDKQSFPVQIAKVYNNNDISKQLSEVEPSVGNDDVANNKIISVALDDNDNSNAVVGFDTLGLSEKDISHIFSHRNVEDDILSYGEIPEYPIESKSEVKVASDTASTASGANKTDEANKIFVARPYEVYTNAPIEVEEESSADRNGSDKHMYKYKRPQGKGLIAIIIDDMGLTLRSRLVEVLPKEITLSYLPYAKKLNEQVERSIANGHEIMVHVPMEPINSGIDAGSHTLKSAQSKEELLNNLNWGLSHFRGYIGVNNHMGSKITTDKQAMDQVMEELKSRGLFFIDSRTIGNSVAADSARNAGIPYAVRDIFIDHKVTTEFIKKALQKLENKAITRGYAIAIGHPHKETINALKEWIPTLKDKGLTLVPISRLLNQPVNSD